MTEDLELKLADAKAKQGRPAQPGGPRRRRIPNPDAPPPPPDAAELAAGDYDPEDLERAAAVEGARVRRPVAVEGRLERSRRQLAPNPAGPWPEHPAIVIGNDHGWLGCDWAGLARMADSRQAAGVPLDDLDLEALRRANIPPE